MAIRSTRQSCHNKAVLIDAKSRIVTDTMNGLRSEAKSNYDVVKGVQSTGVRQPLCNNYSSTATVTSTGVFVNPTAQNHNLRFIYLCMNTYIFPNSSDF